MRNLIIMNESGKYFSCDYPGKINVSSKRNMKKFFKLDGTIRTMPLKECLLYLYKIKKNQDIYEQIEKCSNTFNMYIIMNVLSDNGIPPELDDMTALWTRNAMLSELFGHDIYAESNFIIISEEELINGPINVTNEEYDKFIKELNDICFATYTDHEIYLNRLDIFVDADTIFTNDKNDTIAFQKEYIGTKKNNFWTDIEPLDNGDYILKKSGILMYQCINDAELYFYPQYRLNEFTEKYVELVC